MANTISPLGWVLIAGLAIFILAINLGLFLGVKKKIQKDNWIDKISSAGSTLRDPFRKENDQFQELSNEVEKFKPKRQE
ncbi:MAG: hypothetical protein FD147_372 [Chloroflexi bacterium]|nr:MAG: hypothetical protein FD147_372 [Chloroflexota bacterium]MBA4375197.1 hypothetical protein [Anaerolinea sp.]